MNFQTRERPADPLGTTRQRILWFFQEQSHCRGFTTKTIAAAIDRSYPVTAQELVGLWNTRILGRMYAPWGRGAPLIYFVADKDTPVEHMSTLRVMVRPGSAISDVTIPPRLVADLQMAMSKSRLLRIADQSPHGDP